MADVVTSVVAVDIECDKKESQNVIASIVGDCLEVVKLSGIFSVFASEWEEVKATNGALSLIEKIPV